MIIENIILFSFGIAIILLVRNEHSIIGASLTFVGACMLAFSLVMFSIMLLAEHNRKVKS